MAYEVWTPLWPNVTVDITPFADRKAEAIRLYMSQVADRDYTGATLGLNRFRGLVHAISYGEAFYKSDVAGFTRLTAMLDEV
jgi:N-acetylglucosamine malate deacetylase 1